MLSVEFYPVSERSWAMSKVKSEQKRWSKMFRALSVQGGQLVMNCISVVWKDTAAKRTPAFYLNICGRVFIVTRSSGRDKGLLAAFLQSHLMDARARKLCRGCKKSARREFPQPEDASHRQLDNSSRPENARAHLRKCKEQLSASFQEFTNLIRYEKVSSRTILE